MQTFVKDQSIILSCHDMAFLHRFQMIMIYIYIYPTNSQSYFLGYPFISHFWLPSPVPRPRSRDEEETEDALHEAGEGVVRVGRSWEGDLPHADG